MMAKKIVKWCIYKKTTGVPYPGEYWDDAKNERDARKKLTETYNSVAFRVVKMTLEAA